MHKIEIDYNKSYYNNHGQEFKIIKEIEGRNGARWVRIRFEKTGYETNTKLYKALEPNAEIRDNLVPSVYGIGCLGYAKRVGNEKIYDVWTSMLYRCYIETSDHYNTYGAKGITVCERWKRFDFFLEDIICLPGYQDMINNPHIKYQLDKDILQQGIPTSQKVYSPETCMWVPEIQNNIQRIIDNKSNCINNQYYGVQLTEAGTYLVRIRDGKNMVNCGTYYNIIAAANVYNHYAKIMGKILLNDVIFMEQKECMKYLARPRTMCILI